MFYIILSLLVGMSFISLFFPDLEHFKMWHTQGMWVQIMIMIAFSWSFFEKPKYVQKMNIPLGLLHLWVGGTTAYICMRSQMAGVYNYWTLFPYFNFLCLIILYTLITQYLTKSNVETILSWLRYVIIATLGICVLQYLGLSQFFVLVEANHSYHNNIVTGFIGNGTHLSGFLAMCLPLFLWKQKREDWLAIILLLLVLCLCGTSIKEPSISGFVIILFVFVFMSKRRVLASVIICSVGAVVAIIAYNYNPQIFGINGRISFWTSYLPIFKSKAIIGHGLGAVKLLSTQPQFPNAHHVHMEYFQYAIELGLIGLVLIFNVILDFIRKKPVDRTDRVLKAIVYGFLLSCLFNFPSHLWLPSTIAIFMYAAFHIGENNNGPFQKRNTNISIKVD